MNIKNIIEIAEDRIFSDLCLKWYLEKDENIKEEIYKQIIELYKKINNKE